MDGSLSIAGNVSAAGITEFSNEACEAVSLTQDYVGSSIATAQPDLQDIKSYFERPRLIDRGSLTFGTRNLVTGSAVTISTLAIHFPQWTQRLSGVYGVRFKLNFRLQIAATPFHQGLLSMNFQYASSSIVVPEANFNFPRHKLSASCTNLPHVRLDLSENTMAELSIPYLYKDEFSLVDTVGASASEWYGYLGINQILPSISVTGLAAPSYELYIYLTDMELYGADNNAPTTITLQSGLSSFGKEVKEAKLLSKGFDGVARVSNYVARNIPSLASFAGPVAWAAGTASGIAKYLGWSRPLLQDPTMRINKTPYASESNVDLPMPGFTVGLMQSNTLAITPEVGATNVDEMALEYITSQWSQICVGSIIPADTHNKVVYATPVCLPAFWFRAPTAAPYCNITFPKGNTTGATSNSFLPSSLMNIASMFRLWRGDFKFRITFAKTKFHGGRYMISYNPSFVERIDNNTPIATVEGPERAFTWVQPYGYSMIMDLRDTNIFEFEVPFMCPTPYATFSSSIGGLSIVCMDPLQTNTSVSPSVPFLVEVCGSNFELADFAGPWFVPFPAGTVLQQSGGVIMKPTTKEANQITIGEKITSAKQLIQVPHWISSDALVNTNKYLLAPWFHSYPSYYLNNIKATPMPTNIIWTGNTAASYLSKMYVFVRGGTDHHVYMSGVAGMRAVIDQAPYEQYAEYRGGFRDMTIRQGTGSNSKVVGLSDTALHVRSPAFQNKVRVLSHAMDNINFPMLSNPAGFGILGIRGHIDRLTVFNATAAAQPIWYSRSAADDATMAQYIGPVPVLIPNSGSTSTPDNDWY